MGSLMGRRSDRLVRMRTPDCSISPQAVCVILPRRKARGEGFVLRCVGQSIGW